ncbi:hypothetical protein E4U21_001262, partial [Claviceps maximensis]
MSNEITYTFENNISSSSEASEHSSPETNPRHRHPSFVDTFPRVSVQLSDIDVGPAMCASSTWLNWSLSLQPVDRHRDIKCSNYNKVLKKTLSRFDRYVSFRDYSEPWCHRFRASQDSDGIVQAERRAYFGASYDGGNARIIQTLLVASSPTLSLLLPSSEPITRIPTALSSNISPIALSQIFIERNIEAGSTRARASPNVLLTLHSQARRDHARQGHNIMAIALGIDVFRRILDCSIPTFGLHRANVIARFASEVLSPRLSKRQNSGPADRSKISEDKSLAYAYYQVLDAPNLRDDFYCS